MSNKARKRQKITGEKYTTALMHMRGQCGRCAKGTRCDACLKEPCWTCLPECPNGVERSDGKSLPKKGKCDFDDLQPDGRKACSNCGRI